jgi:membrane fusion protein, macrolide-specific efflux system
MRLKVIAIVMLLVVGGIAVAASLGAFSPPANAASTLLTSAATTTDVTDEIAATGTVGTASQYALAFGAAAVETAGSDSTDSSAASASDGATVTWPVTAVEVTVGDHVTKGQVLATAASTDLNSQIADARRTASSAALQLKQAKADKADASGTAAKRQARINLNNAASADAKAKSDLAALLALRPHATITAPADGTVTQVNVGAGADAPSGTAITMISGELQITTNVVESDIAAIKIDQAADVTIDAIDASLKGTVVSIDPVGSDSGSSGVVSFGVVVQLDSPPAELRPGMSADISIVAASATNVIAVPSRALSGSAGAYTVRVVAADGSVSVRSVEVGLVTSSLAEIKSGLQAGEQVVTGTSSTQNSTTNGGGFNGGGAFPGGGIVRQGRP